jgi:predicted lipoprotein with Yx(FWY)xxD motif
MRNLSVARLLAVLPLLAGPAVAQDAATIMTAESEEHGAYLTDGEGMSLYLFEADTQGRGDTMPVMTCEGECLEHWPPLTTQGEPQVGEGADAAMLGTLAHDDGTMHVTYNGWPLYYYHEDTEPGQTNGHDIEEFGAEWYLLTPTGEKAGEEEEEEGEASGEAEDADEAGGEASGEAEAAESGAEGMDY